MSELVNEMGFVNANQISGLLSMYRIGKKPLARLLGWGETTIIRYMDGDIPTLEYSDKLRSLMEDPGTYYEILQKNQNKLTNVAYRKSKQAVISKIMENKINRVIQYILQLKKAQSSLVEMQILLFYSQAFSLLLCREQLFEDEYTIGNLYSKSIFPYQDVSSKVMFCIEQDTDILTLQEQNLINSVVEAFSWYGIKTLGTMFEQDRYSMIEEEALEGNLYISKESILKHFQTIAIKYEIIDIDDIQKFVDLRFREIRVKR